MQSKKHKEAAKVAAAAVSFPAPTMAAAGGGTTAAPGAENVAQNTVIQPGTETQTTILSSATTEVAAKEAENDMKAEEDEMERGEGTDELEMPPPRMGQTVCIFCNAESPSFEDNCAHMLREHG